MRRFEDFNPIVLFVYFMLILIPAMFLMNLYIALITWLAGIIYLSVLKRKIQIKGIFYSLLCAVVVMVSNMLISHSGTHILFFINDRAITIEAAEYGLTTGVMLAGMFIWFLCLEMVLTTEKIYYIFRFAPKLALMISMILRLVSRYLRKYQSVNTIKKINEQSSNEKESAMKVMSGVFTYALENSMQTAVSMEYRGAKSIRRVNSSIKFKGRDGILLGIIFTLICCFCCFKSYRLWIMAFSAIIPFLYRGKEACKLWIYNLKK